MRLLLVVMVTFLTACRGEKADAPADLGAQTADVAADTRTLEAANAAANEVVRSAGDCDAVKAALPEALRKLDEAERSVRTSTGQTSLRALRTRVNDTAQMCP